MGSVYSGLMQGVGAAEKVFEFIDRQPTMAHNGSLAPDHLEGRVDFENVTFTYRTRPHTQVLQVRLSGCAAPRPLPFSCTGAGMSFTVTRITRDRWCGGVCAGLGGNSQGGLPEEVNRQVALREKRQTLRRTKAWHLGGHLCLRLGPTQCCLAL